MKRILKVGLLSIATLQTMCLASCKHKVADDANTLEIYVVDAGYKTEWAQSLKTKFLAESWVKEKYPELNIVITTNDNQDFAATKLNAGKNANTYDLMFGINLEAFNGKSDLLDLTESVYNKQVPGESVTYAEKMQDSYLYSFAYRSQTNYGEDAKYYMAPWAGGNMGFVYNEDLLLEKDGGGNYKYASHVPYTTDELVEVCQKYTAANYNGSSTTSYAFLQSVTEDYFNSLFRTFWAQYQSVQGYIDFYNGIDDGALSVNIFKQKGRLESLKVLESLLLNDKHYLSPRSKLDDFMISQTSFLRGGSLFNCNGDWFISEMKQKRDELIARDPSKNYKIKMMKTPVVSGIINECDTIEDDSELSSLIAAIDAEQTSLSGEGYNVSQDDYDRIKEARSVVYSLGACHGAVIPSYATAKDVASDFLLYMATDAAQDAYIEATHGSSLPFKYDLKTKNPELYNSDKLDIFHKERIDYMNNDFNPSYTLPNHYSFPLRKYGYVEATSGDTNYYGNFIRDTSRLTPQNYYDNTIEYWTEQRWNNAINLAGLN